MPNPCIATEYGKKSVQGRKLLVQSTLHGHSPKGLWVAKAIAGGELLLKPAFIKPCKVMIDSQKVEKAKGRALLQWYRKKPLEKVEYYPAQEKEVYGNKTSKEFNKLFWGDNLQVLSHLLKEYRGKIDLIYIDPPFDSKADYARKVQIRGEKITGQPESLLEEKQYTDMWEKDEYFQFMYERLLILRELLSETGSIYLHCDWHRGAHLRLVMDEIFGDDNFQNEIVWHYKSFHGQVQNYFPRKHDLILFYKKTDKAPFNLMRNEDVQIEDMIDFKNWGKYIVNGNEIRGDYMPTDVRFKRYLDKWLAKNKRQPSKDDVIYIFRSQPYDDVWDINYLDPKDKKERTDYPTQKPEALLERIIKASSGEGGLVLDCFCGSGTTLAVAQKLGRRWIGCDINIGAIQTTTKRIAQIIDKQNTGTTGLLGFKVYNVNEYDIFKNEIEAKEIVMEMYAVTPIKRSYFDGTLDNYFVKVMPLNRVLNKLDIRAVIKSVEDSLSNFTAKATSKASEEIYEQGVIIICSGAELDTADYLKKENKTGVSIEIRDILNDKKNLIFKKKPEAKISVENNKKQWIIEIKDFYSPILMRKLELENQAVIDKANQAKVDDFRQIIDSVAIDIDYDGKLFNAEIIDVPTKRDLIKAKYEYEAKNGKATIAVKIVDVLGEEYFETFSVSA